MEYRDVEFTLSLSAHGHLVLLATGDAPDPPLTQPEMDNILEKLNDQEEVTTPEPLLTQRMSPLEVTPAMVAAAMRDLQEGVSEQ